jgi:Tc5 transposase DNA-binding domain
MEIELNKLFQEARAEGRKIGQKWILRHAKEIYRTLHPERAIQGQDGRWKYTGFKFSQGWFQGFQRRFCISLRCGTKRAQKTPEQLRETIQSWL